MESFEDVWSLAATYGGSFLANRKCLWRYLDKMALATVKRPWVSAGDFNEIISAIEKQRATMISSPRVMWIGFIETHFLILDKGQKFTWVKGSKFTLAKRVRLYCAFCKSDQRLIYLDAFVSHLPIWNCDHCPILVIMMSSHFSSPSSKCFRFQALWMEEP